jgi:hypothetical protein
MSLTAGIFVSVWIGSKKAESNQRESFEILDGALLSLTNITNRVI